MAITKVDVEEFLRLAGKIPVIDARSPSEYAHAHIPGAWSLPIFDDAERARIGTAYKQESREKAIRIGLDAFGKKMTAMVDQSEAILKSHGGETRAFALHCWRGGMRSGALAWLLDLYGFKIYVLNGGYKFYRRHVLAQFGKPHSLVILGGCTGANKTGIIVEMKRKGISAIDLEGLAGHLGSAFGNLEQVPQPGQEQFENDLARELMKLSASPDPIWLEAESQRIGRVNIPQEFFVRMRSAPMVFLDVPFDVRLKHIVRGYGGFDKDKLINAIVRIRKKLGGLEMKTAVNCLLDDDVAGCFRILLKYYDKLYLKTTEDTDRKILNVASDHTDAARNLHNILEHVSH